MRSDFKRRVQPSAVTSMETVFAAVAPRTGQANWMESPSTSPVAVVSGKMCVVALKFFYVIGKVKLDIVPTD